jgi:DNA-3-methyladenine glycosylase
VTTRRTTRRTERTTRRGGDRMVPLRAAFFARDTARVARDLLGRVIETRVDGVRCRARIVETEAYVGEDDPACHAAVGRTRRTEVLSGRPGLAYVYFVYGMHWCVNAVTRREGQPSAVLIRAAEPIEGEAAMFRRRPSARRAIELTSGPGRLCAALGITGPAHHGRPLQRGAVRLLAGCPVPDAAVAVTPRIGVAKAADWPLRFLVRESPFVSARAQTARWISEGAR